MTLPILFSRRAERALVEICGLYSSVSSPLGEAFLAETDRLAVRISRTPLVFPSLYRDVRRARPGASPTGCSIGSWMIMSAY